MGDEEASKTEAESPAPGRLRRLILHPAWGVVGVVVGVVGILLAGYFYIRSKEARAPVFIVDPVRSRIIDRDQVSDAPLSVQDREGKAITTDVTSIRFYLVNRGRLSIRPEHVLTPLYLTLLSPVSSERATVLDFRVIALSRTVVSPALRPAEGTNNEWLKIDFRILEENDGFTGQIIYAGSPDAALVLSGEVEGVKEFGTNESVARSLARWSFVKAALAPVAIPTVTLVLAFAFGLVLFRFNLSRTTAQIGEGVWFLYGATFAIVVVTAPLLFFLRYDNFLAEGRSNVTSVVPRELIEIGGNLPLKLPAGMPNDPRFRMGGTGGGRTDPQ